MQLASILPPPSGHRECYMQITVTMPGAEDHIIVQSQDEIYVMIDYLTNVTLANSDNEILRLQSRITITLLPSRDGNRPSIRWRSRRRSNKFSKEGDSRVRPAKSYRQVKSPRGGSLPKHAPRSRPRTIPRSRPRFYWSRLWGEHTYEVDRIVTEADFDRWLPNQDESTNLRLNAEYRWLPAARYILQSMRKHCTELRQRQHAWTW